MHRQANEFVGIRINLDAPIVAADQHDVLFREPLGGRGANARLAADKFRIVLHIELPPTGANKRCVALPQRHALFGERVLQILRGNFVINR